MQRHAQQIVKGALITIAASASAAASTESFEKQRLCVPAIAGGAEGSMQFAGLIALSDPQHVNSAPLLWELRALGVHNTVTTGDVATTAFIVTKAVRLDRSVYPLRSLPDHWGAHWPVYSPLILLGVLSFMNTTHARPTSLIALAIALILAICGVVARTTDLKRRGVAMHMATTVGVLGSLGTAKAIVDYVRIKGGIQVRSAIATEERVANALLLPAFTVLCVHKFVDVRRARMAHA